MPQLFGAPASGACVDPEDLSAIVRAYQDCCAGVVSRFEGYVARYMGDGMSPADPIGSLRPGRAGRFVALRHWPDWRTTRVQCP